VSARVEGVEPSPLDVLYPFAGPCWICGGPDKRHRLADAIVDNVRGGDSPQLVADAYDVPESTVLSLLETADRNRARHKVRWSP
jgi:hypothetical protein